MVNTVKVEGPYQVHDRTVATGTTISALTLCKLEDPRTASASTAGSTAAAPIPFAGILVNDKFSTDGSTEAGFYTKGVFTLTASGEIAAGDLVTMSGTDMVTPILDVGALMSGAVVGKALQSITKDSTGEIHVGEVI